MFYWVAHHVLADARHSARRLDRRLRRSRLSGQRHRLFVLLAGIVAAYYRTKPSRTLLFWLAFVLARPLGAVVGDLLDKPHSAGGLELSRYWASAALLGFILACLVAFPQRASARSH